MERQRKETKIKTEAVPLLLVYKQDGEIRIKINKGDLGGSVSEYELYGYLRLYLEALEKDLIGDREED